MVPWQRTVPGKASTELLEIVFFVLNFAVVELPSTELVFNQRKRSRGTLAENGTWQGEY